MAHLARAPSFLAAIETALPLQSSLVTSCRISKNNATQHSDIKIQANIVPSLVSFEIELEEVAIVRNTQRVRKSKVAPATCPAIGHELAAEKIELLVRRAIHIARNSLIAAIAGRADDVNPDHTTKILDVVRMIATARSGAR